MSSLWHRGRGSWSLAAGVVAGLLFLASSLLAGAKASSAPGRDDHAYATLLLEDLRAVPSFELGPKQYRLVIEALRKAYRSDPKAAHREESLLTIGRLYEEMATRFGDASHHGQSVKAYRSLLTEFPQTSRRAEVADLIRALGGEPPPKPGSGEATGVGLTPVSLDGDGARSGAMPVEKSRASSRNSQVARVRQVRYWSHPDYTRIIVELDRKTKYKHDRVAGPERVYFDFLGSRLDTALQRAAVLEVNAPTVQRIRVGQNRRTVGRVVLDLTSRATYSVSWLSNPPRLAIELRTKPKELLAEKGPPSAEPPRPDRSFEEALRGVSETSPAVSNSRPQETPEPVEIAHQDVNTNARRPAVSSEPIPPPWDEEDQLSGAGVTLMAKADRPRDPPPRVFERYEPRFVENLPAERVAVEPLNWRPVVGASEGSATGVGDSAQVAAVLLRPDVGNLPRPAPETQTLAKLTPPPAEVPAPLAVELEPPKPAKTTSRGQRNLIRALGLKLGRVVIDPGHGGRHTGSIGPTGLMEKDVVNDIAQRLGALIEQGLGAEVIYTRTDDRFVSLRRRTQLANDQKADLFISIHVNAARQRRVRGVETYYLNFTTDKWAMAVASRENAAANRSVHELQDLLSKIALKETIDESREFAAKVQSTLHGGLAKDIKGLRNRGVRKAPMMVLIGAKMPAILVEIGFISNPGEEKLLKSSAHRKKVAQHIYSGVAGYADTLSTFQVSQKKAKPAGDD